MVVMQLAISQKLARFVSKLLVIKRTTMDSLFVELST
jgi:hypothetical protein